METIKFKAGQHTFELVEQYPMGYEVWNIGRHNFPFECYIPLAKPLPNYRIDPTSLKAIKAENETIALAILKAAGRRTINEKKFKQLAGQ